MGTSIFPALAPSECSWSSPRLFSFSTSVVVSMLLILYAQGTRRVPGHLAFQLCCLFSQRHPAFTQRYFFRLIVEQRYDVHFRNKLTWIKKKGAYRYAQ